MFKKIDWKLYNKPPFLPGWMCKSETLKFAEIPDKQLDNFESTVYDLANQFDEDVIKNNTTLIDRMGSLLELERQGRNNHDYLQLQNLRKLLNVNNSTVNDIIKILKLYYNNETIHIIPDYPAGIHILHYGESKEKVDFNTFIKEVIGAGIQYATEEYYNFNEFFKITESSQKLKKYDVDEIHYDGEFKYDGFMQYGNMRASRNDNHLNLNEVMNFDYTITLNFLYRLNSSISEQNINGITYKNGKFIGVGDEKYYMYSEDGVNWDHSYSQSSMYYAFLDVAYGNGYLVGVGNSGLISVTTNDLFMSSNSIYNNTTNYEYLHSVTYSEKLNMFVAVGDSGTVWNVKKYTRTLRTSGVTSDLYSVIYADNMFVAVGVSGAIVTSTDGITWTSRTSGVTDTLHSVAYSEKLGMFVAVGNSGTVITSTDGITWTSRTSGVTSDLYSVACGKTMFVAVGYSRAIVTSIDGINWISYITDLTLPDYVNCLIYENGLFVGLGWGGSVITIKE